MQIGILTHHYINNFGAFLQAYSLQEVVKELFPNDDVNIIDCINVKHYVINTCGWFRFYIKRETLKSWLQKICLPRTFGEARKKHMNLTRRCYNARNIEKLGLDYIIVGSDEVWNYREIKGNAKVKFGIGLDKEGLIAYAPSVGGTDDSNIPGYVKRGIYKFKAVSARDALTEKLAKKIRNEKIQRVVDPTLLVQIPDESVKKVKKPYILFYYCEGLSASEREKIFKYARECDIGVYGAGENDKVYSDITVNLTPFQWVWMFRNAGAVITGTFHGVVFSMINHKQFACFLTNPSRIKKVSSLLDEFGLSDRKCIGNASEIIETLNRKINYDKIEVMFEQRREESRKFLKDAIQ